MSTAATIAAYVVASNASRSGSSGHTAPRNADTKTDRRWTHHVTDSSPEGAASIVEKTGWVLVEVDFASDVYTDTGRHDTKEKVRFKWDYYFVHSASGRVWHASVCATREVGDKKMVTEEEIEKALAKAWGLLYEHLRRSEGDAS